MMQDLQDLQLEAPAPAALSVMDTLQAIQMECDPTANRDSLGLSSHAEPGIENGSHVHEEEHAMPVSPSEIINSVEQDPAAENHELALPSVPEGTTWAEDPVATFLTDSLGPQRDPASAVEPNVASLANTAPALSAADQVSDMGIEGAFSATAPNRDFGSRLHVAVNDLATVSPAQLTGPGSDVFADGSLGEGLLGGSAQNLEIKPIPDRHNFGILPSGEDTAPNEYLTVLPPLSRNRPEVTSLLTAHIQDIHSFNNLFSHSDAVLSQNSKATVEIDAMLQKLTDMSNLPPYYKDLELEQEQWMRYARENCSKLAFLYEFLERLQHVKVEFVILAAGGVIMDKVEAIVNQLNITYRHASDQWPSALGVQDSPCPCKVVLVDTNITKAEYVSTAEIVVAYDESAESSGLLPHYKTTELTKQCPVIFTLIEAFSLEHINRRLSPTMAPLERRHAQVNCIIHILSTIDEDALSESVAQPHDLAQKLATYLVQDTEFIAPQARWQTWQHARIPDEVFVVYEVLRDDLDREQKQLRGQKRARQTSSSGTQTPKRPRISPSSADEVQLSEALKVHLGTSIKVKGDMARVSVEKLEDLVNLVSTTRLGSGRVEESANTYSRLKICKWH